MWKCCICLVFYTLTLRLLLSHMQRRHGTDPGFHVRCPIDGCPRTYRMYNSFYRHVRRVHGLHYDNDIQRPDLVGDPDDSHGEEGIGGASDNGDDDEGSMVMDINAENETDQVEDPDRSLLSSAGGDLFDNSSPGESDPSSDSDSDIDDEERRAREAAGGDLFDNSSSGESDPSSDSDSDTDDEERRVREGARFICAIKERNILTQTAVDDIMQSTDSYVGGTIYQLKKKIQRRLIEHGINPDIADDLFQEDMNPFRGLHTAYLQEQAIQAHLPIVASQQIVLGPRMARRRRHNREEEYIQEDTFQYVPILKSIEQLLNCKDIYEMVTNGPTFSPDGYFRDICDGGLFSSHPIFSSDNHALQLILYYDDVEIDNPIGTYSGKHKVGMFYYSLTNIHCKYRSKLEAVRLLAIVNTEDIKEYGYDAVLRVLVDDLQILAEGYTFNVNGDGVTMKGSVLALCADTNACLAVAGFKEGVGFANHKCRHCECTFENMQSKFRESDFILNTHERHLECLNQIERARTAQLKGALKTTYGINRRSALLDIPHLDITKVLPNDIMHVILEGIIPYECREILRKMIFDERLFTLKEFNRKLKSFPFGYNERKDKPGTIPESVFNQESKLKMTADQTWTFIRHLPIILSSFNIDPDNEYMTFLNELCEITSLLFSNVTSNENIAYLRFLITNHLKEFKRLFPNLNIHPKQHYMIHLPSTMLLFGPLIRIWCMRFEGKHAYFKKLARKQNHKNIPKSMTERNLRKEASEAAQAKHPMFASKLIVGPSKKLTEEGEGLARERLINMCRVEVDGYGSIYTANWVKVSGTTYSKSHSDHVAFGTCAENSLLPEFGQIVDIWVAGTDIYLVLKGLETEGFVETYQGYEVSEPNMATGLVVTDITKLLDHNVYYKYRIDDKYVVPLKYDLSSAIDAFNEKEG